MEKKIKMIIGALLVGSGALVLLTRKAGAAAALPREAALASCQWPLTATAGQASQIVITVNQGSSTENYKLVFSGDLTGESSPFIVNAGTKQQHVTIENLIFTTGGQKNVSASLIKV